MTHVEFHRLLAARHGRALLHLRNHGARGLEEIILSGCLQFQGYDWQCEGYPATYLAEALEFSGLTDSVVEKMGNALRDSGEVEDGPEEPDRDQMLAILAACGRRGHDRAIQILYKSFEFFCRAGFAHGAREILALEPETGYRYVLEQIGKHTVVPYFPDVEAYLLHEQACEQLGTGLADRILTETLSSVPGLANYMPPPEILRQRAAVWEQQASQNIPHPSFEDYLPILQQWPQTFQSGRKYPHPQTWGKNASEKDLAAAAACLGKFDESDAPLGLLRVFMVRPFPGNPASLARLLESTNEKVIFNTFRALRQLRHPQVRAAALRYLQSSRWGSEAFHLLVFNFEPGDYERLRLRMEAATDRENFQRLSYGALKIIEAHPEGSTPILHLIYNMSPCSCCRNEAVALLLEHAGTTPQIRDECRWDGREEIRGLVSGLPEA